MIGLQCNLLCAAASDSDGRKHKNSRYEMRAPDLPVHHCHVRTLASGRKLTSGHTKSIPRLHPMESRDGIVATLAPCDERGLADRGFANRGFANWSFADRHLPDLRLLVYGLRAGKIRSGGRTDQGKGRGSDNQKFQHVDLLRANGWLRY